MMAEACRFGNASFQFTNKPKERFCLFNVFCVFISLVTILADLTTGLVVFAEFCKNGLTYWAITSVIFLITPNILISVFSLRWIIIDGRHSWRQWLTHLTLCGLFERYIRFLYKTLSCKNLELSQSQQFISQRNDLSLLHFLYTFTGTTPQIILQSYAMVVLDDNHDTKAISLTASIASVIWASSSYIYSVIINNEQAHWLTIVLKLLWHFGLLTARISAIILFCVVFGIWTVIFFGLHWTAMTFWIIIQKTTFCPNKFEETFYNIVMGFVYCFCYINLREGHTRYRLLVYYSLVLAQNFGSLLIFILISDIERQRKPWSIFASILIVTGTFVGMSGMILYYRWFHAKGPISWKNTNADVELNNKIKPEDNKSNLRPVRSFKTQEENKKVTEKNENKANENILRNKLVSNNADQKFLLEQWIARSGTPLFISAPVDNSLSVSSIDIHTIANTPQMNSDMKPSPKINELTLKPKKKVVSCQNKLSRCISIEHIEKSIDEITASTANFNKGRRIVCLPDDIIVKNDNSSEISHDTDGTNKKSSSDSIDLDLDLSFSDINSSDINTFNENIVQKLCLSALKNIKDGNQDADIENIQRIAVDILKEMHTKKEKDKSGNYHDKTRNLDTPTELLSVHDYENICAVNIAREAWGLRSWNGYCDIENWLHDGSVVRDRRRDTITSASSDISSYVSQDPKGTFVSSISSNGFSKKSPTYSNILIKRDRNSSVDYVNSDSYDSNVEETFLARPCLVESKDHLEPIIEELDDVCDFESNKIKLRNSERSLVATIDEIRKATSTNSPRNVYYRREHTWDSPQSSARMDYNLKRALWKEPSKINSNNILKTIPEKPFTVGAQIMVKNKLKNSPITNTNFDVNIGIHAIAEANNTINKLNVLSTHADKKKNKDASMQLPKTHLEKWEGAHSNQTAEDLIETAKLSGSCNFSSTQSLISKSNSEASNVVQKANNVKRPGKSKPRRKFSILRERFEPRSYKNHSESVHK